MKSISYKLVEFFIIFIGFPISFVFNFVIWIKMMMAGFGFLYIIFVLLRIEKNKFKIAPNLNWKVFWKQTIIKLLVIALITTVFVWVTDKKTLFNVLLNKPGLWDYDSVLSIVYSPYIRKS